MVGLGVVMRTFLRREEPEDVYKELVDGLAGNLVPVLILFTLLASTGAYVMSFGSNAFVLVATVLSTVASLGKIAAILHHNKCRSAYRSAPLGDVQRLEAIHAATAILTGLSVGLFSASIYDCPQTVLHMIPLCIAYGYAAGLIARVSVRPRIAAGTILGIGIPSVVSLAMWGEEHRVVAAMTFIFMGAALQSISFVYKATWQAVTLRVQIEKQARHDPLTGLLNRFGLRQAICALSQNGDQPVSVHAFDLDGFKAVNDTFGHAFGDRMLKLLAERIQSTVPDGTIVARTGGDEFVMVQLGEDDAARQLAERLHRQLTHPCDIGCGRPVRVGLSLGYASGRLLQTDLEDLTHRADAASYAAKRNGGGILADLADAKDAPPPQRMSFPG